MRAATGTCLSAASYCTRHPRASAHSSGVCLNAPRAVRRSAVPSGRSAKRRGAAMLPVAVVDGHRAAQEQLGDRFEMATVHGIVQRRGPARHSAAAWTRKEGGRRGGARPHSADADRCGKAHPSLVLASTSALAAINRRTARRWPQCAAKCSAVSPLLRTAGLGVGWCGLGSAPQSTATPRSDRKQNSRWPRGSTAFRFGPGYSERTRHRRTRARPPNVRKLNKARKRQLRAKEAAINPEIRHVGRGAHESRELTS